MNGDQQRQHKAVRDELAILVGVVEELEKRDKEQHELAGAVVRSNEKVNSEEHLRVSRRLIDLQMNLDTAVVEQSNMQDVFRMFTQRGFWARMNWLFMGR